MSAYTAHENHGFEAFAQDSDHRQDEERPLGRTSLAAFLLGKFGSFDLLVKSAGELGLPLDLGAVDAEHGEAHDVDDDAGDDGEGSLPCARKSQQRKEEYDDGDAQISSDLDQRSERVVKKTAMKAAPMQRAMNRPATGEKSGRGEGKGENCNEPVRAPAQIVSRIRRMIFFFSTGSIWSRASFLFVLSSTSDSTRPRRTETMMAASMVSRRVCTGGERSIDALSSW